MLKICKAFSIKVPAAGRGMINRYGNFFPDVLKYDPVACAL
jgi:hypothetical protein